MKAALDTNILVYAENVNGVEKQELIRDLIRRLPADSVVVPAQVLGELFHVLVRKAGRSRPGARDAVAFWHNAYEVVGSTAEDLLRAGDLAVSHQLGIWDAVILSAASTAGCSLLVSQDVQDGFVWGGVTVVNPFAQPRHPLLASLLLPSGG